MKKLYSPIIFILFCIAVYAQKPTPEIKPGTLINIVITDNGQKIPVTITVKHLGDIPSFGLAGK